MTNKKTSVGILGAGITGLSVAYGLQKKDIPATVYEKSEQVGGAIKTITKEGWLVEEGPNTLMVKSQKIWNLLDELNLHSHTVEANKKAKCRFVVKNDQPVALPSSVGSFLRTPLLSAGAKLRLLKEPFISPTIAEDEAIAPFIRRRLGKEPLDYGIAPFVSGVYAGDPTELSIKHTFSALWEMEQEYGSLLKGIIRRKKNQHSVKRTLLSFTKGNQALPNALTNALSEPVQTGCEITSAEPEGSKWNLKGLHHGTSFQTEHQILISTLPAHRLATVFDEPQFTSLSSMPYAPLSVIGLGFKKNQIHHPLDGFGMLIPEVEPYNTLGVLFSSTLFGGRAPQDHHLLTCFIGGARHPKKAQKSKGELLDQLLPELDRLLGIDGEPVFTHHTYWQQAIPQYNVGHERYLSTIQSLEQKHEELFLNGNYRNGVSVPDCISSGLKTAQKVATYLGA